jgi:hypothetical protein
MGPYFDAAALQYQAKLNAILLDGTWKELGKIRDAGFSSAPHGRRESANHFVYFGIQSLLTTPSLAPIPKCVLGKRSNISRGVESPWGSSLRTAHFGGRGHQLKCDSSAAPLRREQQRTGQLHGPISRHQALLEERPGRLRVPHLLASGGRLGKTRDLRCHSEEGRHVQPVGELPTRDYEKEYGNKKQFTAKQHVCEVALDSILKTRPRQAAGRAHPLRSSPTTIPPNTLGASGSARGPIRAFNFLSTATGLCYLALHSLPASPQLPCHLSTRS